jgi:hypothetical protein
MRQEWLDQASDLVITALFGVWFLGSVAWMGWSLYNLAELESAAEARAAAAAQGGAPQLEAVLLSRRS